jgi:UDP-N-acetylmuramoyl-tripeptide--D-alanyl-D-alanine ligase
MEPRSLQYIAAAAAGELRHGAPDTTVTRLCVDSRQAEPGDLFFALAGERFDAHVFLPEVARRGVAAVVAERRKLPGSLQGCAVILVDNTRAALGRLGARYRRDFTLPVTAVGGSNGKTTTKELIASVLRQKLAILWSEASFNNEIGVPLTLLKLEHFHQAAVLEAGTNHPGELAPLLRMMDPHFGVITNIGREHLEHFGDVEGVVREEGVMAEALPPDGTLFVNGDDAWTNAIVRRCRARVARVGFGDNNDWVARNIRVRDSGATFSVQCRRPEFNGDYRIKLLGRHQVANALFALALGAELGLDRAAIERGLAICAPAKMRLQLCQPGGIRVLDDAYNANADSMLAALQTLCDLPCAGRRVAVLGDMAELGPFSSAAHAEVGRRAAESGLDQLFTVGRQAGEIASAARRGGLRTVVEIPEVETAVLAVREFARPGDVVLIKASRAMRLERITEALLANLEKNPRD